MYDLSMPVEKQLLVIKGIVSEEDPTNPQMKFEWDTNTNPFLLVGFLETVKQNILLQVQKNALVRRKEE